jgi:serine/threonine protein kinase
LAPERFQGGGQINFKSDIYGVGCIFYEMLHGESPFHSSNYHSLINRIKNDTPEIRKDLPEDFIFFLLGTLEKDP